MKTYTYLDNGQALQWRDSKRYLWAAGLLIPLFPMAAVWLAADGGHRIWYWLGPMWIAVVVPALDTLLGADARNPPEAVQPQLEADPYFRGCTLAFVPLQWAGLAVACFAAATQPQMPWLDWLGLALTVGTVGGVAINTGHELGNSDRAEDSVSGRRQREALSG